ncbi:hypothetical protein SEA_BIPPER_110 [Mycobacterium phage Bipper]|uniref:Uncharacterized protein n=1 Tax=Mycobacterium phage Bipper TaxID=1805457 RepID=A0A142F2N8_9CAUD|nr:hypothetical protein KCH39_gp067 [Mycobacterium phage Bipper]AMQ67045.1 hypothetical protein SEA_BIPPER_110 [Mycobacterium phage Bipper]
MMAHTPVTVELLRRLRAQQGRPLHQARHLHLVPPLADAASSTFQQVVAGGPSSEL